MYLSDSDSETEDKVDKSKYNCPYYNKHTNDAEVIEYAVMEPASKNYEAVLLKSENNKEDAKESKKTSKASNEIMTRSIRVLSKIYTPITVKMLHLSKPSLPLVRVINLPDDTGKENICDVDAEVDSTSKRSILFGKVSLTGYITEIGHGGCTALFNDHTAACHLILVKPENFKLNEYYTIFGKVSDKGYVLVEWSQHVGVDRLISHFLNIFDINE